jgi:CheY-like chemotaxis protein
MPPFPDSPPPGATRHLLLVDDEPAVAELLKMIVESHGYQTTIANSGAEAIAVYGQHEWSVVLTDRVMPGMSGEQLRGAIRQFDPGTPIILISGECDEGEAHSGFDAVLRKPFSPRAILELIDRVVAGKNVAGIKAP